MQTSKESEAESDYDQIDYNKIANRHQEEDEELDSSSVASKTT